MFLISALDACVAARFAAKNVTVVDIVVIIVDDVDVKLGDGMGKSSCCRAFFPAAFVLVFVVVFGVKDVVVDVVVVRAALARRSLSILNFFFWIKGT